VHLLHIEI
jgi:hypothetical protein